MRQIVEMKLAKVAKRLNQHYHIQFNVGEALYEQLVNACLLPDTGARNIDSILNQQILPVVSNLLLQSNNIQQNKTLSLDFLEDEGIVLEWVDDSQPIKKKTTKSKSKPKEKTTKVVKNKATKTEKPTK